MEDNDKEAQCCHKYRKVVEFWAKYYVIEKSDVPVALACFSQHVWDSEQCFSKEKFALMSLQKSKNAS